MSKGLYKVVLIIALGICVSTGTIGYKIGYREGTKLWEDLEAKNNETMIYKQQ